MIQADSNKASHDEELATSRYARDRKELLSFVHALRASGAQDLLDVPRVVVIGNQSAGKSSLVEAISGITVPRDAGTCTRCPMECRMESAELGTQWHCRISLRYEYDETGVKLNSVKEKTFRSSITDKSEVELALRQAQFAILNPATPLSEVQQLTADKMKDGIEGRFSKNVVCVELKGPGLTDLSFIDLPGLIQVAEDSSLVQLVESLVVDHIQGNSIILVTVPMTDDLDNQKALALARKADPDGNRTIGVVTKADAVAQGSKSRDIWLEVIEGRNAKKSLFHGYYCTRLPDDRERDHPDNTPTRAREAEISFFASTAPWSQSSRRDHFGVAHLIKKLSPLLQHVIAESLPRIERETASHLDVCRRQLEVLPKEIDKDPLPLMFELITHFSNDVIELVRATREGKDFIQKCRLIFDDLKNDIRCTSPTFIPQERGKAQLSEKLLHFLAGKDDIDDVDGSDSMEGIDDESPADSDNGVDSFDTGDHVFLDDVTLLINRCRGRELPGNVPWEVKRQLIVAFQKDWQHAISKCIDSVKNLTIQVLLDFAERHFGQWGRLWNHLRICINDFIELYYKQCKQVLRSVLRWEQLPYTQNDHYLLASKEKWLSRYRDLRDGDGTSQIEEKPGREILAKLAEAGFGNLSIADLARLREPDKFETEIDVMAEVRAYFKVAYKRIIDNVPSAIDLDFLHDLSDNVQPFFHTHLKLGEPNAHERCENFFAQEADIVARRNQLQSRLSTLEGVQAGLRKLAMNAGVPVPSASFKTRSNADRPRPHTARDTRSDAAKPKTANHPPPATTTPNPVGQAVPASANTKTATSSGSGSTTFHAPPPGGFTSFPSPSPSGLATPVSGEAGGVNRPSPQTVNTAQTAQRPTGGAFSFSSSKAPSGSTGGAFGAGTGAFGTGTGGLGAGTSAFGTGTGAFGAGTGAFGAGAGAFGGPSVASNTTSSPQPAKASGLFGSTTSRPS